MSGPGPLRVVLDTNVVLDLLHFRDPAVAPIDTAIRGGTVAVMTSAACTEELRRVAAYPEFHLDQGAQAALLARYGEFSVMAANPQTPVAELPRCTDPDDQKFLELAWHCGAAFLVSKDKALLRMARRIARMGGFNIIAPARYGAVAINPRA